MSRKILSTARRAFEEADRKLANGFAEPAAKQHETALALALYETTSIPIQVIEALDIDTDFELDAFGRLHRIVVQGSCVENDEPITATVLECVATRIVRHITTFRPILIGRANSTALFSHEERQRWNRSEHGSPHYTPTPRTRSRLDEPKQKIAKAHARSRTNISTGDPLKQEIDHVSALSWHPK